jgi:hypothetical protein
MHTGDELEKINDPAVQHIAHLARLDKAEDLKAIADWTAYHNPDITFITARAAPLMLHVSGDGAWPVMPWTI